MISEATVIAVAAAIYLLDCVVLLERGQAVLEAAWPSLRLAFGSKHYEIRGKAVALLNPLTPFFPAYRTLALFASSDAASIRPSKAIAATAPLATLGLAQFVLVFIALPVFLYRAPGWPFLIALLLAYVNASAMLGLLCWRFGRVGIGKRPLLSLGFGWLACLPLSVNCIRSAGLAIKLAVDSRRALRLVPAAARERARNDLAAQIAEALEETEEDDERHRRLAELRRNLTLEPGRGRP
jgi:hypothetical protein